MSKGQGSEVPSCAALCVSIATPARQLRVDGPGLLESVVPASIVYTVAASGHTYY